MYRDQQDRPARRSKRVGAEVKAAFHSVEQPAQPREHRARQHPRRHLAAASRHQRHRQNVRRGVPPDVREDGIRHPTNRIEVGPRSQQLHGHSFRTEAESRRRELQGTASVPGREACFRTGVSRRAFGTPTRSDAGKIRTRVPILRRRYRRKVSATGVPRRRCRPPDTRASDGRRIQAAHVVCGERVRDGPARWELRA